MERSTTPAPTTAISSRIMVKVASTRRTTRGNLTIGNLRSFVCYAEAASPRITETSICAAQQLFNSSCWAVSRLVAEVSLPPPQAKCLPQIVWVRRFSHRFHRIHRNSCWRYSPTDFTDQHRWLGCVDSPTDFTEFTELLAGDILPQISQICTDCLGA